MAVPVVAPVSCLSASIVQLHLVHLPLVCVREEEQLPLVVEVKSARRRRVSHGGPPVPLLVHRPDRVGVGEEQLHLGESKLGLTVVLVLQLVSVHAGAFVISVSVLAFLVTEVPLLALVPI